MPSIDSAKVKGPAFSMARYKINLNFFLSLNTILTDHIEAKEPKLWNGYRVLAGDGTSVNLPPSKQIKDHFGVFSVSSIGTHKCLANACMIYDVQSNLVLDSIIAPVSIGEETLLNRMLKNSNYLNSILLLDRGFGNFSICKSCIKKDLNFCVRIKTSNLDFAKLVLQNTEDDFITTWKPSEMERATCRKYKLETNSIQVRVTKIVLNTGDIEILVSNLFDQKTINKISMKQLYGMRWGIEEGYKKLKPTMKLEQFGCRKHEGIYQEFYAHIFMMNLVGIISAEAEEKINTLTKTRKLRYKYNWKSAFLFIRNKFADIFYHGKIADSLVILINQISQSLVAIKDNRLYLRPKNGDKSRSSQYYK